MTEDNDLKAQFRALLHARSDVTADEVLAKAAQEEARGGTEKGGAERRTRRVGLSKRTAIGWAMGLIVLVTAVILGVGVANTRTSRVTPSTSHPTTQSTLLSPTTSTAVQRSSTPTSANPYAGFEPMGSSFINTKQGWVLGSYDCETCGALRVTSDGGSTWRSLPAPPVPTSVASTASDAVSDVYFADPNDGFLYGPGLETTHNGGKTWQRNSLPPVTELTGAAGVVYALAEKSSGRGASLWRNSAGSNTWTGLTMPEMTGAFQLYVEGDTLLLLLDGNQYQGSGAVLGKLWMSTDSGSRWIARAIPCNPSTDGGAAVATIVYQQPESWLVDCFAGSQAMLQQDTHHHLYLTTNAGVTWTLLPDPTTNGYPGLLADNGSGDLILTIGGGGLDSLHESFNNGNTWSQQFDDGALLFGWADLQFVDASTAFVVGPTHYAPPQHLYRTVDGGHGWQVVTFRIEP